MGTPMRLFHTGVGQYFIVDGDVVFGDLDADGYIGNGDRYDGPLRSALVDAARHILEYYDAPYPGAPSLDPLITSGGRLNEREGARFAAAGRGVIAKRPDLLAHLDFFDRRTIGNYNFLERCQAESRFTHPYLHRH